jgi:glycerophosphoryl diester phosphodiesterase
MTKKIIIILALLSISFITFQFFYSGNPEAFQSKDFIEVVAHKGVHQNYNLKNIDPNTNCIAPHIFNPTHGYLENTIESIEAAFNFGATIVEIDIQRSKDNYIVVFHDSNLECLTNGTGKINERPHEYLKSLDIGYNYSFDGDTTFPFRGKGTGKMPTLAEVLQKFPDKKFYIDHKDGSQKTAELLVDIFKTFPLERQLLLYYWGPDSTYDFITAKIPAIRRLFCNKKQLKNWMLTHFITFGMSGFPKESSGLAMGLPPKYAKLLPGWPFRFLEKVRNAGAYFYLLIDTKEDALKYVNLPVDGFVTDYIEIVGQIY